MNVKFWFVALLIAIALVIPTTFVGGANADAENQNQDCTSQDCGPSPTSSSSHFATTQDFHLDCDQNNKVVASGSFTNNESTETLHVTVTDNQSHASLDLGNVAPGQKVDKTVNTGLQSIGAGNITVKVAKASDESIFDTKTVDYSAFSCDTSPTATPTSQPTSTPTVTPTSTPTPTDSQGNNNCDGTNQSGINDNNNCNQQNQNQGQDQTQNNNQNVNITLNGVQPQVLGAASTTKLPSTGTPMEIWELLGVVAPLGVFLRKITQK